ncbi:hypothetical protein L861_23620 [Litchfieldella anticariensis FP35 = DSM 16096]|uniref:Uncharacterized protein n=1 Tax=Litchfieldella anticariensis (strain DSM 16096 / CECT 5854 / CIP 108499 / LMG 22089 / FP35) TaxID=1121939 RepID=S2LDE5_LITA3|nr:hypothetical protein L861_23620 [Halomonas anticariensis FP35 = DSM 16096]
MQIRDNRRVVALGPSENLTFKKSGPFFGNRAMLVSNDLFRHGALANRQDDPWN